VHVERRDDGIVHATLHIPGDEYQHELVLAISPNSSFWVMDCHCTQDSDRFRVIHPHFERGGMCLNALVREQVATFFQAGDYVAGLVLVEEALRYTSHPYMKQCRRCEKVFSSTDFHMMEHHTC